MKTYCIKILKTDKEGEKKILFKNLEAFDRKPPEKSIVQRVADAYEMLGLLEEKQRVLEKYNDLFTENKSPKKGRISPYKKKKK
ncbi:hypothetical protein CFP56_021505 [Quercus suber]|uniref:Uncharacterized protein n=1 Tax=Quercus suber TaxID=58331 RepID=A0AAW0KF87_QUESU